MATSESYKSQSTPSNFIQYDLTQPPASTSSRRQRTMPPPLELTTHRLHPYSRASSTVSLATPTSSSAASGSVVSHGNKKKRKKMNLRDVDLSDRPAIAWTRGRMIMDLVATNGWMRNDTATERELMDIYLSEIVAQANSLFNRILQDIVATKDIKSLLMQNLSQFRTHIAETADSLVGLHNLEPRKEDGLSADARKAFMVALRAEIFDSNKPWTYFLHRQEYTQDSIRLIVFGNLALETTHLNIWYRSKFSPFRNMSMRAEIETMMPLMLSESAAGVQCAIDRLVEGRQAGTTSSKGILKFSTILYAGQQAAYHNAILECLADPLHKEPLQARFLALHRRGLEITDSTFGLSTPSQIVCVPTKIEEIVRPLLQSSSAAHTRTPVQEGLQYLTGHHHTDLTQETSESSMALYSDTGSFVDEELEYSFEVDKNLTPDTFLNQGTYGFF
ncbi:hypothetical protein BDR06DRAFT_975770 [Suillus hirtellus]|nr:hypothetical protein BDR06DRAFT_975770 [Suillus hirtellus]